MFFSFGGLNQSSDERPLLFHVGVSPWVFCWKWVSFFPAVFFLDRNRQGAKKVIFTACHSGKLNLTFTSPNIISTSTKNVLMSRLISQFSCILNSSKNFTCPSGKLITEFTSPIAKSSSPGLSHTAFFARWTGLFRLYVRFQCRSCDNTLQKSFLSRSYMYA